MTPGFNPATFSVWTDDGHNFRLISPVVYTTRAGETILITGGSESDGASTPPEAWAVAPPFGWYWRAAVLHDFLYRYTQRPKAECDALLLEAMEVLIDQLEGEARGLGQEFKRLEREFEAKTFYLAVTVGGGCSFEADRAAQKTGGTT